MAMISLKNLVAPVSNSVHLASIVFVILVFGVWRWSGGEVNFVRGTRTLTTHSSDRTPVKGITHKDERTTTINDAPVQAKQGSVEIPAEAADDLLGSILNDKSPRDTHAKSPNPARDNRPRQGNSLEDIERSLGIR